MYIVKKTSCLLMLLTLLLTSCDESNFSVIDDDNLNEVLYSFTVSKEQGSSVVARCIVEGNCSSLTCSAEVECGCDESPKCKCTLSQCECDCEAKEESDGARHVSKEGKLTISMTKGQYLKFTEFKNLVEGFSSKTSKKMLPYFDQYLEAFSNGHYSLYKESGKKIKEYYLILPNDEKAILEEWLELNNETL